tara:strand:- start:285 stop:1055 length:771 start_codon:yes stop_codon:yes gene_type:complete
MEDKIKEYYSKFEEIYTEENYPEWFKFVQSYNRYKGYGEEGYNKNESGHKLGHYAILQTQIHEENKILIVGNNNSWFVPGNMKRSLEVVRGLQQGIPEENFYTKGESDFAKDLNRYFASNGSKAKNIFDNNTVGLNRLWLQTGPQCPPEELAEAKKSNILLKYEWTDLQKKCKDWTKEIIEIVSPKLLLLLGGEAKKLYPEEGYWKGFWIQHCPAPSFTRFKQKLSPEFYEFSSLAELTQYKEKKIRNGLEMAKLI